jgi:iron-sulfur cluster assembly protein
MLIQMGAKISGQGTSVIEVEGVRVLIDPKSLVYLAGAELHWEKTLMRQGFKFVNPNEKTNCGCGHSFTV